MKTALLLKSPEQSVLECRIRFHQYTTKGMVDESKRVGVGQTQNNSRGQR